MLQKLLLKLSLQNAKIPSPPHHSRKCNSLAVYIAVYDDDDDDDDDDAAADDDDDDDDDGGNDDDDPAAYIHEEGHW